MLKGKRDVYVDAFVAAKTERRNRRFIKVQMGIKKIFKKEKKTFANQPKPPYKMDNYLKGKTDVLPL